MLVPVTPQEQSSAISLAEEAGSTVEFADERSAGTTQNFALNATLTDIQGAAVDELARHDLGVLVAPPGRARRSSPAR